MSYSVLIPVYNESDKLRNLMGQILDRCEKLPDEIVVVDDGSDEPVKFLAELFRTRQVVLKVLEQKHRGVGYAIKAGLERCRNETVLVCHADVQVYKTEFGIPALMLENALAENRNVVSVSSFRLFEEDPEFVACAGVTFDMGVRVPHYRDSLLAPLLDVEKLKWQQTISDCFEHIAVRRSLILNCKWVEVFMRSGVLLFEDLTLQMRRETGGDCRVTTESLVLHPYFKEYPKGSFRRPDPEEYDRIYKEFSRRWSKSEVVKPGSHERLEPIIRIAPERR